MLCLIMRCCNTSFMLILLLLHGIILIRIISLTLVFSFFFTFSQLLKCFHFQPFGNSGKARI